MLWSGTRPGDTMADLIFCLGFLRLQVTLEERLTQRGIVSVTASARKGIFGGQHEEDCTSLFNPGGPGGRGHPRENVGQALDCTPALSTCQLAKRRRLCSHRASKGGETTHVCGGR